MAICQLGRWLGAELPGPAHLVVITPTFTRPAQRAELTRLAQVAQSTKVLCFPPFFQALDTTAGLTWVVVEDRERRSEAVGRVVAGVGLHTVHLACPAPTHHARLEM